MSLPPLLYVRDLRRLLPGWDSCRIRRFLDRNGLTLRDKGGDRYTTSVLLHDRFPDAWRAMQAKHDALEAGTEVDPEDFADLDEDA